MIFLLLKNGRLRVNLLVALLLVLGTVPEGSEGLTCYNCPEGKPDCAEVETCGYNFDKYCVHETMEDVTTKECMGAAYSECFKKIYGSCVTVRHSQYDEYQKEIDRCLFPKNEGRTVRKGSSPVFFSKCICDTDLCNKDSCSCDHEPFTKTSSEPEPEPSSAPSMPLERRSSVYLFVLLKFLINCFTF